MSGIRNAKVEKAKKEAAKQKPMTAYLKQAASPSSARTAQTKTTSDEDEDDLENDDRSDEGGVDDGSDMGAKGLSDDEEESQVDHAAQDAEVDAPTNPGDKKKVSQGRPGRARCTKQHNE
jgi:hypothetical protein